MVKEQGGKMIKSPSFFKVYLPSQSSHHLVESEYSTRTLRNAVSFCEFSIFDCLLRKCVKVKAVFGVLPRTLLLIQEHNYCPDTVNTPLFEEQAQHWSLPPAYVKRFMGNIPKDVILKDTSGNLWHMEIEEDENGVSLKHGWQKFASDHSLEYGEFLIFEYNGNSLFNVKVYGENGCMKKQSSANNFVDRELKMISTTVKFEDGLNDGQSRQRSIHSGKRRFKEKSSRISKKSKGFCDATRLKSQGIYSKVPELAATTNPHFVASVCLRTPYHLEIPNRPLRESCLKLKPKMMFRTQDGKLWPVNVVSRKDGRYAFGSGWKEFWTGNSIGPQDTCGFEFIVHKNRTLSREIPVTILRTIAKK